MTVVLNRRQLLTAAPAAGFAAFAAGALPVEAVAARQQPDRPFVMEVTGGAFELAGRTDDEVMFALCYPCRCIKQGNRYMLADGTMIFGEDFCGLRVDYGCGWQDASRDEINPQVVGWVVSLHAKDRAGWHGRPD